MLTIIVLLWCVYNVKSKIMKRSWVLHECLERVPEDFDAMHALLKYGLRGTDLQAMVALGNHTDNGRSVVHVIYICVLHLISFNPVWQMDSLCCITVAIVSRVCTFVYSVGMCGIDFLQFWFVLKKTLIRFGKSLVWFGSKNAVQFG